MKNVLFKFLIVATMVLSFVMQNNAQSTENPQDTVVVYEITKDVSKEQTEISDYRWAKIRKGDEKSKWVTFKEYKELEKLEADGYKVLVIKPKKELPSWANDVIKTIVTKGVDWVLDIFFRKKGDKD